MVISSSSAPSASTAPAAPTPPVAAQARGEKREHGVPTMDDTRVWNASEGNSDNAEVSSMELGVEGVQSARAALSPADTPDADDNLGKNPVRQLP